MNWGIDFVKIMVIILSVNQNKKVKKKKVFQNIMQINARSGFWDYESLSEMQENKVS